MLFRKNNYYPLNTRFVMIVCFGHNSVEACYLFVYGQRYQGKGGAEHMTSFILEIHN